MTCVEFRLGSVVEGTRGEIAAFMAHAARCRSCHHWLQEKAKAIILRATPEQIQAAEEAGTRMAVKIIADEEAMETIFPEE